MEIKVIDKDDKVVMTFERATLIYKRGYSREEASVARSATSECGSDRAQARSASTR
jgi:hypothetical protein